MKSKLVSFRSLHQAKQELQVQPMVLLKLIFDAKYGEWLGAHFIGANVTEMIAEVVVAETGNNRS